MADIKISQLTAATSAASGNEFEINEAGTSKKLTTEQIATYVEDNFDVGKIDATAGEVNTGTSATKVLTPDALAGSYAGTKVVQIVAVDYTTALAVGDGKAYFHVPAALTGMNLVSVHAEVITAGTTGTTDIQIHNVTDAADMLTTKLTIDSAETGSDTAATAAVINAAADDVATNDLIRIDIDAISTTAPQGLIVTLEFRLP